MSEPDTPAPREPVSTDEAVPVEDLLADVGMDGAKWAAAFRQTAIRLGYPDMDEGWLIGWFCNAIMAGYDEAQRRAAALTRPPAVERTREPLTHQAVLDILLDKVWGFGHLARKTRESLATVIVETFGAAPSAAPTGTRPEALEVPEGSLEALRRYSRNVSEFLPAWRAIEVLTYIDRIAAALRVSPEGRTDAERPFGPGTDADRVGAGAGSALLAAIRDPKATGRTSVFDPRWEEWLRINEQVCAERDSAVARVTELSNLLQRIYEWDHMDTAGDGPFWRHAIATTLAGETAAPPSTPATEAP